MIHQLTTYIRNFFKFSRRGDAGYVNITQISHGSTHQGKRVLIIGWVVEWIQSFKYATHIVTDPFPSCVFANLFNKPFTVVGNSDRELERFNAILRRFTLEKQLTTKAGDLSDNVFDSAWLKINNIMEEWQTCSMNILTTTINGK
jgi:hypothetical protein